MVYMRQLFRQLPICYACWLFSLVLFLLAAARCSGLLGRARAFHFWRSAILTPLVRARWPVQLAVLARAQGVPL
jgi:hypothetical protein